MTTTIDTLLADWTECERTGDAERLAGLLDDEFAGIGPVGFVLDKRGWLGRFEMGLRYEQIELDEVVTHRHGDATFVIAHQRAKGTAGPNQTPTDLRVSFTVVPGDDADLRIAAMQYSFIGMPEPVG
ncbi:MAG TPA: nuclear transport factor 2 family protein [Iamia sp.]|jgi:ketosteroid isomerase-like protein|nr:nuclear transport factor 2 family protein [Iamia sp.]